RTGGLNTVTSRLLVSVSGASAATLPVLTEVTTELDRRAVPVSLFLRPRAVPASRALARWVRSRLADGDDVLIHGYGDPPTRSLLGRRPEFAGLPAHEAGLRISAAIAALERAGLRVPDIAGFAPDRKSTRLNSSHVKISYAVFCLKKKKKRIERTQTGTPITK